MDWITFLSKLIDSVVWPVSIIILALIFRSPLSELIQVLKKFKYKGFELEFDSEVKKLHSDIAKTIPDKGIIDEETKAEKSKLENLQFLNIR